MSIARTADGSYVWCVWRSLDAYIRGADYLEAGLAPDEVEARTEAASISRALVDLEGAPLYDLGPQAARLFGPAPGRGGRPLRFRPRPNRPASTAPPTPECIAALGLSWPCSEDDVRRAFKELVVAAHPDAGGDPAHFIRLRRAYEHALVLTSRR